MCKFPARSTTEGRPLTAAKGCIRANKTGACVSTWRFHDTWICDTNTLCRCSSLVLCSAYDDNEVSPECYDLKQSLRTPRATRLMFQLPRCEFLCVEEQQNVCGSKTFGGEGGGKQTNKQTNEKNTKAWLVFCILPPHSASRTALGSPSEADHDICLFFFFFFVPKLNSCYPCLCPSTESSHWMQQLVVFPTEKKNMSLVTIWFHDILIFVLFIYYIYWNITLCAGM